MDRPSAYYSYIVLEGYYVVDNFQARRWILLQFEHSILGLGLTLPGRHKFICLLMVRRLPMLINFVAILRLKGGSGYLELEVGVVWDCLVLLLNEGGALDLLDFGEGLVLGPDDEVFLQLLLIALNHSLRFFVKEDWVSRLLLRELLFRAVLLDSLVGSHVGKSRGGFLEDLGGGEDFGGCRFFLELFH